MAKASLYSIRAGLIVGWSLLTVWFGGLPAHANPLGGTVTQGAASFSTSGSQFTINQTSANALINWQSFNIGVSEITTFVQPSASSVVWNQINDPSVSGSQILGHLNANGYVVLQNLNGFTIGGQAAISAHGLIMTTTPTPAPNLSSGGAWQFNTPPPLAKIINYGQINIVGGGAAFLIANTIENDGTISNPNGQIGLYAGQQVLVSMSPDGRGLSTQVTLPAGSVDNEGRLIADGGTIMAQAIAVNQNGLVQANSVGYVNGTIELLAGDSLTLGANSVISAKGGPTAVSPGGSVLIQSGNSFADQATSTIDVSGAGQGGNGGKLAITAPQISSFQSSVAAQASAGYAGGSLSINTESILLNTVGSPTPGTLTLNLNTLPGGLSLINLQAANNIELNSIWNLADSSFPANLNLNAGSALVLDNGWGITAGKNWNVNLSAGSDLALGANAVISAYGQVNLQSANNIELNSILTLSDSSSVATLNLNAGNNITLDGGSAITAGKNWGINLTAGNVLGLAALSSISAPGGNIALHAKTINQNGTIQADSAGNINGSIELVASDSLNLEANSLISASGDATSASASPGGFVVLQSGNTYADTPTSQINVSGWNGGQDGIVEIFGASPVVQSSLGNNFACLINPYDITLSSDSTDTSSSSPNFNITDLASYLHINLHALNNIELSSEWFLSDPGAPAALTLKAGNSIILDDGTGINADNNWGVNLVAGTGFVPTLAHPKPASGSDGIYLNGTAYIQTQDGDINLWAANEVRVATGSSLVVGNNGIRTRNGGNITVNAQYGDVNAGSNPNGYVYNYDDGSGNITPYVVATENTSPDSQGIVGGISTAAGGNVTIHAGGNVTSYLPTGNSSVSANDAGSGAFGPEPGNVTITAGGSVYGNYVLANGVGSITAGHNVGAATGNPFALSLIAGSWSVNAPNGNIYLQEVRNPNGVFNNGLGFSSAKNLFDYSPQASVDLTAYGVYLTGQSSTVPRPSGAVPILYPPILDITAGAGGVTLAAGVTLFPSPYQSLDIVTTDGGNLVALSTAPLLMSDSSHTQWLSTGNFGSNDHGSTPGDINDPNPVLVNISGSMENLNLITSKATQITVGGDMINCGFSGQNLHASDATTITVAGQIDIPSAYSFVTLPQAIPSVPASDLPAGVANLWDNVFTLALDPAAIASLTVPANYLPSQWYSYIMQSATYFQHKLINGQWVGINPGFTYNPATGQLGYGGPMLQSIESFLTQSITILHLVNGLPVINPATGHFEPDTISWADFSAVQALYNASMGNSDPTLPQMGYRLGGPGQFNINANSISLGNSYGILSCGVLDPQGGFSRYANLASITPVGATVNVTVADGLDMLTSTIAAIGGGDVNVNSTGGSIELGSQVLFNGTSRQIGFGILNSGPGNVNVTAYGDINIAGSRIAAYDGGNILVESRQGSVNIGSGGDTYTGVLVSFVNPATGLASSYFENAFGSGIVANTLLAPAAGVAFPPDAASLPGNIIVETPQGNITASLGGITQESPGRTTSTGPTITLVAGTLPTGTLGQPDYSPGYAGNIDLGQSGVIGGTVNISANGNISGLVISRQNSNISASQNFSGSVLSGGSADVSGGGTVSGVIIGVGGASVSGGSVSADVISQNASVNGGLSQSTLGTSASATSASQSAAQQSSSDAKHELASTDDGSDDDKKKKKLQPLLQRFIKRVTVILPKI